MLYHLKKNLSLLYQEVTAQLTHLFGASKVDEKVLRDLEKVLIEADMGVGTTKKVVDSLRRAYYQGSITEGNTLHAALSENLFSLVSFPKPPQASLYLLVGINGSGKTTSAAKLASFFSAQNKRVLLVAADTFRPAAVEQLKLWATKLSCDVIEGTPHQDPASVVYAACERFKANQYDIMIIDTAGRLTSKVPLMKELEKIRSILTKKFPDKDVETLLTLDAHLGQSSFEQAKLFKESTSVSGLILTKMDGTGKGGIIFSIADTLKIPPRYLSYGEQLDQFALFNPDEYISTFLGSSSGPFPKTSSL